MAAYIIRRLLIAIPVLIGVTIVNFIIMQMAPGNPVDMLVNPKLPPAAREAKLIELGLNESAFTQYINWMKGLFQGDLGYSMITYQPVLDVIVAKLGPTLLLMGTALIIGLLIAFPIGLISATKQYSKLDYFFVTGSFLGVSIPNFFLGLVFIYIFSIELNWLPSGGMSPLGSEATFSTTIIHMILPVSVLVFTVAGRNIRYIRSSMLEILGQDYLRTARAKGLSEQVVILRHAMKNALIPIVTVIGLEIPLIFGGAVVIEQIFSWPGIGQLMLSSIMSRDYSMIMGLNLLAAVVVIGANLVTDIAYAIIDPKIRTSLGESK